MHLERISILKAITVKFLYTFAYLVHIDMNGLNKDYMMFLFSHSSRESPCHEPNRYHIMNMFQPIVSDVDDRKKIDTYIPPQLSMHF